MNSAIMMIAFAALALERGAKEDELNALWYTLTSDPIPPLPSIAVEMIDMGLRKLRNTDDTTTQH